jgi:hypothetical protein
MWLRIVWLWRKALAPAVGVPFNVPISARPLFQASTTLTLLLGALKPQHPSRARIHTQPRSRPKTPFRGNPDVLRVRHFNAHVSALDMPNFSSKAEEGCVGTGLLRRDDHCRQVLMDSP